MKKIKSLKQVIRDRYKDFPSEFTDTPTKQLAETLIKKNKLTNPKDVVANEIRAFMSINGIKKAKMIAGEVGKGSMKDLLKKHRELDTEYFDSTSGTTLAAEMIEKYGLKKERAILAGEIRAYKSDNGISSRKVFDFGKNLENKKSREELKNDKTEIFRLKQMLELDEAQDYSGVYEIRETSSGLVGEAVAVGQFSDVHFEERIDLITTNGLNEYNPKIAKKRCEAFFVNFSKLVKNARHNIRISKILLQLGGDNIHGWIHEEYLSTNYMKPMEATLCMEDIIISGINHLLRDPEIKEITLACNVGNHSRTTDKVYSDTEALLSYEWMLYKHIERYFSGDKRIKVIANNAYFTYVKVYDYTCRLHHGHAIKFGGGVGGLTVPLMKFIYRSNEQIKADYDFIDHFHTRMALPNVLINGSVCGFNGYSVRKGFRPDKAVQSFALIAKNRGLTVTAPVFLE